MVGLADAIKFTPASAGTVDFVYSSTVAGFRSPVSNLTDAVTYHYRAESADLSSWEIGVGTWTASSSTLARTTVLYSSTGSKINFAAAPHVAVVALAGDILIPANNLSDLASASTARTNLGIRDVLSASRTYYVRTDGSDSNTGLADTAGGAFLTIQKAIDTIAALDIKTYSVTIQVAAGTYTGTIVCNGPWIGSGVVTLQGDTTTPSNCLISTSAQLLTVKNGAALTIKGFKLVTTAGHMMECLYHGALEYSDLEFGSAGVAAHVRATDGGKIKCTGACTISGNAGQHWAAVGVGAMIRCQSKTITLSGTPAFNWQFANAQFGGGCIVDGCTFSGSGTGPRYNAASQGFVYTAGAGTSYLPGNSAGSGTNPSASPYGLYY